MRNKTFKTPSGATLSFSELGFGAAPIGNLYAAVPEAQSDATLDAAWAAGIRYFDTAPLYGLGLSETRLNRFLRGRPRGEYLISTKVGRLMQVCPPEQGDLHLPELGQRLTRNVHPPMSSPRPGAAP